MRHLYSEGCEANLTEFLEMPRYVYVVPCILENDVCFLKTIFPSRKYTAKYLGSKGEENE